MRYLTPSFVICLFAGALSQAVAAEPPQPPAATTSPPPSNVSTAPSAAATAAPAVPTTPAVAAPAKVAPTASDAKAEIPTEVGPEKVARLRAMGYKPTQVNGRTVFCRREAQLGTRFDSKVCASPEEVDKATQDSKDMIRSVQRNNMQPTGK